MNQTRRPDGIEPRHVHDAHGARLQASPFGLLACGLLLGAALLGFLGTRETVTGEGRGVQLSVEGPSRIRSGEVFEMTFTIEAQREIRDAVLSIDQAVWHDVTINTMIPTPTEERFTDGSFELHFGAVAPGSRLLVKVDGQINPSHPPGSNEGEIAILDGAASLASVDYSMRVLP